MQRLPHRFLLPGLLAIAVSAQQQATELTGRYTATEQMLLMRDGVKLHTIVVSPKTATEPLPFVMLRTPYGVAGSPMRIGSSS